MWLMLQMDMQETICFQENLAQEATDANFIF